jgi:hypothetical protein
MDVDEQVLDAPREVLCRECRSRERGMDEPRAASPREGQDVRVHVARVYSNDMDAAPHECGGPPRPGLRRTLEPFHRGARGRPYRAMASSILA